MSNKLKGFASHPNNIYKTTKESERKSMLIKQLKHKFRFSRFVNTRRFGNKSIDKLISLLNA